MRNESVLAEMPNTRVPTRAPVTIMSTITEMPAPQSRPAFPRLRRLRIAIHHVGPYPKIMEATTPTTRPTPTAPPTGINKSALIIVFLVVFIDLLGFGIVLPLLPRFAEDYVDTLLVGGRENRLGGLIIGLLMSSFSLMQFLFAPVWGRISDRVGRRPILLLGLGGSVLFYLLFGYALTFTGEQAGVALALLFAARIGAGIAGATISTAQAVIADST